MEETQESKSIYAGLSKGQIKKLKEKMKERINREFKDRISDMEFELVKQENNLR